MKPAHLLLIVLAFLIVACSSTGPVTPPPTTDYTPVEDYTVGVGDSLQISVWRNEELSVAVPVRPDGKISMPLIGDIVAAGHTPVDLAAQITQGLKSFVRNPQVTVIVVNPSSADFQRRIRITGAVQAPQSIPYREGITVLDLVLLAGGTNEFASGNNAKLYRRINGETKVYPIHLDDLINKGKTETNYPLIPSDIVTVPERVF